MLRFATLWLLLIGYYVLGASSPQAVTSSAALARANNEFGFELQNQLTKDGVTNTFFSPINIGTALAMTYLGARGQTAAEMENVLGFRYIKETDSNNPLVVHQAYKTLLDSYNQKNKTVVLYTANNIYPAKDFALLKDYSENVVKFYNVNPVTLDYSQSAEAANTINKFVEDHTNNRIKDLFSSDAFNTDTKLVLVSAIYFKGLWKTKFNKEDTIKDYDFKLMDGKTKKVEMMKLANKKFYYLEDRTLDIKMIELPYDGNEISMYVILPGTVDGLKKDGPLLKTLTAEKFNNLRTQLSKQELEEVKLPKFKLETKYDALQDTLKAMKLQQLFDASLADLSGMGRRGLAVSGVVHQAFVQVDEEGTEAAAATGVLVHLMSRPILPPNKPKFVANRSFVFFLYHKKTEVVLFQGIISDPPPVGN